MLIVTHPTDPTGNQPPHRVDAVLAAAAGTAEPGNRDLPGTSDRLLSRRGLRELHDGAIEALGPHHPRAVDGRPLRAVESARPEIRGIAPLLVRR
jgi:hypothetical protein